MGKREREREREGGINQAFHSSPMFSWINIYGFKANMSAFVYITFP